LSIFTKDVDAETITQAITEEDPSTIQFENAFRNIVNKIQFNSNNRVIIVLDNVDRLPVKDIPEVWSSIRSLLKRDEATDDYPDSFVTVIIPYDRKYVLKAFNLDPQDDQAGFMSEDVIRKTFKRVFYVSPTVPSDWKSFFKSKLSESISYGFSIETVYRLEKILEYHFQELKKQPTPRQIINHINELAVLWQAWGDIIDIHSLSIFTCIRSKLSNDPNLLKTQIICPRIENLIPNIDWRRDIASLIFNVDRDHAYQALLSQDLSRLLPAENSDELKMLTTIKGFTSVVVDLVQSEADEWSAEDPHLISNVVSNVMTLELEQHELDVIFLRLASTLPTLADMDNDVILSNYSGLMALPGQIFNPKERMEVIKNLTNWANKNIVNIDDNFKELGKDWADFYSGLIISLTEKQLSSLVLKTPLPSSAEIILGIANAAPGLGVFNTGNLTIKRADLEEAINEKIESDKKLLLSVLKPLEKLLTPNLIKNIQTSLANIVKQPKDISGNDLDLISNIFYFTYSSEVFEDREVLINDLVSSVVTLWHLKNYYEEEGHHQTYLCWLMLNQLGPVQQNHFSSQVNHPQLGNLNATVPYLKTLQEKNSYSNEQIDDLVQITSDSKRFTTWLNYAEKASDTNSVFTEVLKKLLIDLSFKTMNASLTARKYAFIKSLLDSTQATRFLHRLSKWSDSLIKSFSGVACLDIPPELLFDIDSYDIADLKCLIKVTDAYLKEIDANEWETHLETASDTLGLVIRRQKLTLSFTLLVNNFRTPVVNHARKLLEGTNLVDTYKSEWSLILQCFRPTTLTAISKDMLNIFTNTVIDETKASEFIIFYKDLIAHFPIDKTSEPLIDRLLINLVATSNETIRQVFRDNSINLSKIYKVLSRDAKTRFDDILNELRDDTDDEDIKMWAKELSSLFNG
ncbi:MAG TPA: hypothetical protein DIT31_03905, partial [Methylophaga sp.]|nr:hypothetical protein [Methylophaga sp.]